MEPKNGALEDDFPLQTGDFQVPMLLYQMVVFTLVFVGILQLRYRGYWRIRSLDTAKMGLSRHPYARPMEGWREYPPAPKSQEFNWRFSSSRRIQIVKKA